MVSPVRIRVPPLLKVLQIREKVRTPGGDAEALCQQYVNSRLRKGFFKCGRGGDLHAVGDVAVGVEGYGYGRDSDTGDAIE